MADLDGPLALSHLKELATHWHIRSLGLPVEVEMEPLSPVTVRLDVVVCLHKPRAVIPVLDLHLELLNLIRHGGHDVSVVEHFLIFLKKI